MTIYREKPEGLESKEEPTDPEESDDGDDVLARIDSAIIRETKDILKASFVRYLTDEEMDRLDSVLETYAMDSDDYFKLVESIIPEEEDIPLGVIYELIEDFARR